MKLVDLKVLGQRHPLGIDENPYFSWIIESNEKNVRQKSWHIIVYDTDKIIWDSGVIESEESAFVPYQGEPLSEKTTFTWSVTITDQNGNSASEESFFETGFKKGKSWKAHWVETPFSMKRKTGFGNGPAASVFRKTFSLADKKISRARVYATCHGIYELTINGQSPDDRLFAPENTYYAKYLCYQTYDITDQLKPGSNNMIGMTVGDGWYCGSRTKPEIKDYNGRHAVLFQLEVIYEDKSSEIITSDNQVKVSQGAIRFNDLYGGEKYDANYALKGWTDSNYDDSSWRKGIEASYGYSNLVAQLGEPVRKIMELPCKKISISPKGETILDFGRIIAGSIQAVIDLPKGSEVSFEATEVLDKDGNYFNNMMIKGVDQKLVYVSDGKPGIFEPHFSFQGFRYLKVTGITDAIPKNFTAVVFSTDSEDISTFECSDNRINQLYKNIRWSQRSNTLSIPTDCPQREKAGWTGDAQIFCRTALLNEDGTNFWTRWLRNLACEQKKSGAVPMVIPMNGIYTPMFKLFGLLFGDKDHVPASAGWSDAATIVPFQMYQITGNKEILRSQYESMHSWTDYVYHVAKNRHVKTRGLERKYEKRLWNKGFHWGEWLIPSFSKNGYGLETVKSVFETRKYVAPIYSYYSTRIMAKTAAILGKKADCELYTRRAEDIKEAFYKWLKANHGEMPMRIMGAYVMPIYYNLVPDEYKEKFADTLVELLKENDYCLDTGFLGTPCLFDALTKIGRLDLAYKVFLQDKSPSYMSEIKQGASTIWESWFVYKKDGDPMAMSLNHYAFGCVADWMYRTINGLEPIKAGFKRFRIEPKPHSSLTYGKREYKTAYGWIRTGWTRNKNNFKIKVTVPCNTDAVVTLPDGKEHHVGSGTYLFETKLI